MRTQIVAPMAARAAAGLGLTAALVFGFASGVYAQSISMFPSATGSGTVPPPPPPGPCLGTFSPDGDIFDLAVSVPMGPPGCGLGWPGPPPPAATNVNAFSSGLGMIVAMPFPAPAAPGTVSLSFGVDSTSIGDSAGTCTPGAAGATPPDVSTESCAIAVPATDGPADAFATSPNASPFGVPGAPAPGSFLPHSQLFDGDGVVGGTTCSLAAGPPLFLVEPFGAPGDEMDAFDVAPIGAWDSSPADGVPDIPVYYSVDAATAAASGGFATAADVIVGIGGAAAIYAPAAALGLGPADDVDALAVFDAAGDGIYVAGTDQIFYSVAPGSVAVGAPDCAGVPIEAGDILFEGGPFGSPGVPCIVGFAEDFGIWSGRFCGPQPLAAHDNLDALDIFNTAPTTTTTSTTTTSTTGGPTTTTSTTTTTLAPLCGSAPEVSSGCRLNAAGKGQLQIKDKTNDKADQIKWKWKKGDATTTADFKDPVSGSATYRFCVYEDVSGTPAKIVELDLPPGGTCGTKPCWKALGPSGSPKGFKYKDKDATPDGITGAKFKEGVAGKAQVQLKAKGVNIPMPTLPLTGDVTAQLLIDDGISTECFQTTYTAPHDKNDAAQFKAKGP